MKSFNSISEPLLAGRHAMRGIAVPEHKSSGRPEDAVAEALAVLMVDLVSVLPGVPLAETLERLTNRIDDRGRTPNGSEAAGILAKVGVAMMRMGL